MNLDTPPFSQGQLRLALSFAQAGRSVIPLADLASKKPRGSWKDRQLERMGTGQLAHHLTGDNPAPGIAVVCGKISGGGTEERPLWLVCLDFDTKHHADGPQLTERYRAEAARRFPGLLERLPEERTQSGGTHFWFRSPVPVPQLDLARNPAKEITIETRGEGYYAACAPTPGYTWVRGDLVEVPELSEGEVDDLFALAREYDEFREVERDGERYAAKSGLPGTEYVEAMGFEDVLAWLTEHAWRVEREREEGNVDLTRPGKDSGVSANLRDQEDGPPLLYVYTSSTALPAGRAYTIFQVRAYLEYEGDFRACAKALRDEGYGEERERPRKADEMAVASRWIAGQEVPLSHDKLGWRRWTGNHWGLLGEVPEDRLSVEVGETLRASGLPANASKIKSVLYLGEKMTSRDFDKREGIIPFENAILKIDGMEAVPHDPEIGNSYVLPFAFAPGRFPKIWRFLRETIPDPVARRAYMAHVGLAMRRDARMYKMVILHGGKRSGKGTCLKLANLACGQPAEEYAGESIFSREQEGLWSRAEHADKRVACLDELPVEALQSEDIIKTMAAHEGVAMRPLHGKEVKHNKWRPKLMAATNNKPRFADPSGALRERLVIIECPNTHTDSPFERDPAKRVDLYLLDKLIPDVPAFASMCLLHAERALRRGHYPSSESLEAAKQRVTGRGDAFKAWLEDCCETGGDKLFTPTTALWESYNAYCGAGNYKPLGKDKWLDALAVALPACRETKRLAPATDEWGSRKVDRQGRPLSSQQRGFAGIALLPEPEEVAESA